MASLRGASGTLEERDRQIERSGLFGEYPAILSAYVELFQDGGSSLEALKRAVFLVWRAAMAPSTETGIASLPDATARAVIEALARDGAAGVVIAATHPILSGPAVDRLKNSAVTEIVVSNTLPIPDEKRFDKLTCLSIAPLLSQAIKEVFEDGSVTKMFDGQA